MSLKMYLILALTNLKRNKKSLIKNIIIIGLAFIIFITSISITKSINNFINDYMLNSTLHRSIMVECMDSETESVISNIKSIDSVIDVYEYQAPIGVSIQNAKELFENQEFEELSLRYGYENEMPGIIAGGLFSEQDSNVGIIPKKFYPNGSLGVEFKKEEVDFLDGEEFIGKVITTEYEAPNESGKLEKYKYEFKVVGVYDSVENIDESYSVYIPYNDIEMINSKYRQEYENSEEDSFNLINVLVDKSSNLENTIDIISSQEDVFAFEQASIGLLEILAKIILCIGILLSIITFKIAIINTSLTQFNSVRRRYSEFGVMKAFGYKNRDIKNILIIESIVSSSIGLLFSYIVSKNILFISNNIIKNNLSIYMDSFNLELQYISILISFIVMIITSVISCLKSIKYVTDINPVHAIKK